VFMHLTFTFTYLLTYTKAKTPYLGLIRWKQPPTLFCSCRGRYVQCV
jgi:hypothetical protein